MEDHSRAENEANQKTQNLSGNKAKRIKRLNLMLMLVAYLMFVLPGTWIYIHLPGAFFQVSDGNDDGSYTILGLFVIGFIAFFTIALFVFVKWRGAVLANEDSDGFAQALQRSKKAETPAGVSNTRVGYLFSSALTVLALLALITVGIINGNGTVRSDLLPTLLFGVIGLIVGLISLYFGVRCGHCGTGLFSLMRQDQSDNSEMSYSGDTKEMYHFMFAPTCTKCGILRR